eukprot:SM000119S25658  [mRNA]  locus=s119:222075:224961:- [translate_table: standard]
MEDQYSVVLREPSLTEVSTLQRTLVEAWGIVREAFVDPTFNHQNWDAKLGDLLVGTATADSPDKVHNSIRDMLATLNDPYTRIVNPEASALSAAVAAGTLQEYESFSIANRGAMDGVGLLISSDSKTGRLVVVLPIEGSPADRAGILSGDELLQINRGQSHLPPLSRPCTAAQSTQEQSLLSVRLRCLRLPDEKLKGVTGEEAAGRLRGHAGTLVTLTLRRMVELRRETITMSPVFAALLPHAGPQGTTMRTGYVRLAAFSQAHPPFAAKAPPPEQPTAAADMAHALASLERQGVTNYILDLRDNPGGLVKAGLDIAGMWLDGPATAVVTVDRHGGMQRITVAGDGHALTKQPLAVLVNAGSASASEILAGALRDNGRATLVGETTYGKGRIQSVYELADGSAIFVTVAKYLSPGLHAIDKVGLAADAACGLPPTMTPAMPAAQPASSLNSGAEKGAVVTRLLADACIVAAERQLDTAAHAPLALAVLTTAPPLR